jgi:ABC-type bacteriocin/lantibiotic exporter with double-glycine peptidase domain
VYIFLKEFLLLEEKADVTSYTSAPLASKSSTSNASLITKTIKLENLSAGWIPEHNTLTDISLDIGNKELLVVVGHVGAGKVL